MKIGTINIDNNLPFTLISGPCAIENLDHALYHADYIKSICERLDIPFIYKSSFDKANRTSINSDRGVGIEEGLTILEKVKKDLQVPILTDVHEVNQCEETAAVVDIIQIPAFLCRQTDLLLKAAYTGCAVNIKKGQFLAPWDMKQVVSKIKSTGNNKILLTERGSSFGYNTLVSDMRSIPKLIETNCPVVFDATHSVQQPGGKGISSGGERKYVSILARAAVAIGVAGIFIETHKNPDEAPSDGPNMIPLNELESLLKMLKTYDDLTKF